MSIPLLPKGVAVAVGVALAVAEAVQIAFLHLPGGVHDAISLAIIVTAGLGVVPATAPQILKLIPVHVAAYLTALVGILETVQRSQLGVGVTAHAIIGAALAFVAALGIVPLTPQHVAALRKR